MHKPHKEDGNNLRKYRSRKVLRCEWQEFGQSMWLCLSLLFSHSWTHISHKGLYQHPHLSKCQIVLGTRLRIQPGQYPARFYGCDTTVLCGLWVLIPSSIYEHSWCSHTGEHSWGERNQGSNPGSDTLRFLWSWTSDLTCSVPWLVQLNRSHKTCSLYFKR